MPETDDQLRRVLARRWRVGGVLTLVMMLGYFGFILVVAFAKPLAGTLLAGGRISVGILLGAATILLAPLLTLIYVRWANGPYDAAVASLKARQASEPPP